MAYTALTAIQQWVAGQALNASYHELNRGNYGAFEMAKNFTASRMAPVSEQTVVNSLKTLSNTPRIPVLVKDGFSIYTTRKAVGTAPTLGSTAYVSIVRRTAEVAFTVIPSEHEGNAVSMDEHVMGRMAEAIQALKNAMDANIITDIDAAKSQVSNGKTPFTFDGTADAYLVDVPAGVTDSDEKIKQNVKFFEQLNAIQNADKIKVPFNTVLVSPNASTSFAYSKRFATGNYENLQQVSSGLASYISPNISEAGTTPTVLGVGYAFAPMSLGLYTWTNFDAKQGYKAGNVESFTQFIPELGFDVEMYIERNYADLNGTLGAQYEKVYQEKISMSFDYVTVTAYNSAPTTVPAPIVKYIWRDNA